MAGLRPHYHQEPFRSFPTEYIRLLSGTQCNYSAALARFVSADTLVPGAANPQALNRYMYVLGNAMRLVDPSGRGPCDGKSNDDFYQCRWFTAHGYENSSGSWRHTGVVRFQDLGIITELLREAGITWLSGDKNWEWQELTSVATGVSDLMSKLGGGDRLSKILGGVLVGLVRMVDGIGGCKGAAACKVSDTRIEFYDGINTYDFMGRAGVAVHELAHIIGSVVKAGDVKTPLFTAFPYSPKNCFAAYACDPANDKPGNGEYFSDAVYRWVYRKGVNDPDKWQLSPDQATWLDGHLK